ncbi:MAG TPA: NAD(P)-dependent alcohol dehydrogenase [Candidatus Limnocylindria bacterium]
MSAQAALTHAIPATTAARETTMQAVVQDRYGTPDVLRIATITRPAVADDEVLIRVHAAGIARGDWHLMTGRPYLVRAMGFGLRRPTEPVRGQDLSGTVESVGAAVTTLKRGDEVYGWGRAAFAEYAVARASDLLPRPSRLSFEQAASIGISGMTAIQAVRDVAKVGPGTSVLITGAGGGVGTYAVQIAVALGATVTGAASTPKLELVRSLGATDVIDTSREDFTRSGRQWDVIIDTAGRQPLRRIRKALAPDGTLALVGGEGGDRWLGGFDRHFRAMALSRFIRQDLKMVTAVERGEDLAALDALIDAGKVTPIVDSTYPLADAVAAMRHHESGRPAGKVVLSAGA